MSQSESGLGAVIIAVIVIGAGWVCFSMMHQSQSDGSNTPTMPDVSILGRQSKINLAERAKNNPYVDALLSPRAGRGRGRVSEGERFSQLLKKRLGAGALKKSGQNTSAQINLDTGDNARVDQLLTDIGGLCDGGETGLGLARVKEAMAFVGSRPNVSKVKAIDLALIGSRLSYREHDFDQSRQYIDRAIALSHQNQDYKMDDLEGLRCLLNGNSSEATRYNLALSQYNETMSKSDYSRLPKLADELVNATVSLPEDSYFRLQAGLTKANAMNLSAANAQETTAYLKQVEAQAKKAQDEEIAADCEGLLAKIASN